MHYFLIRGKSSDCEVCGIVRKLRENGIETHYRFITRCKLLRVQLLWNSTFKLEGERQRWDPLTNRKILWEVRRDREGVYIYIYILFVVPNGYMNL